LELYYRDNPINTMQKTEIDKKIEELEESIKKQESYIEKSKKEREELMKKGEFLINNMYLINELIFKIQKNMKIDIETLNEEFKTLTITNINLKDKHITINVNI
ncbi:MAG: hypothetical protein ACP5UN_00880, partial [Candidatus Micrarchaeia archaeon]